MARASLLTAAVTTVFALAASTAAPQTETRVKPTRDWAYALALQRDGKLVVAGRSVGGGWRFALARYTTRGRLDPAFGRGGGILTAVGRSSYASALAIQPDGKLVAAGRTYVGGTDEDFAVARYLPRAGLDTGFGRGGTAQAGFSPRGKTTDAAFGVAIQRDGKLVLAGGTGNIVTGGDYRFALARFTARGTLDPTFGHGGKVASRLGAWSGARGVAIQPDGKIVAAGYARFGFALARYTRSGTLDPSFGQGGTILTKVGSASEANAVAVQPDGKIVAAGIGGSDFALVRYTASGKLDPSFGRGGKVTTNFGRSGAGDGQSGDEGLDVAIQHDGKLVVAGSSNALGIEGERSCCIRAFALARYTVDGELDPTFGNGGRVLTPFAGIAEAQGVVIQPDGKIVAAGGGAGSFVLARYTASGRLDPTFGRGGKVVTRLRRDAA